MQYLGKELNSRYDGTSMNLINFKQDTPSSHNNPTDQIAIPLGESNQFTSDVLLLQDTEITQVHW